MFFFNLLDLSKKSASIIDSYVKAQISEQYHIMKWYRSMFNKTCKRTKFGFSNCLYPYIDNKISFFSNNYLDIHGNINIDHNDNEVSFKSNDNLFDEDFLVENIDNFSEFISYNILTNEIILNNNKDYIKLFDNSDQNLIRFCSQLINVLQYDRRISSIISGKLFYYNYYFYKLYIIFRL